MRVLLTNDDGIEADGLLTLREALLSGVADIDLLVVAPDGNRSALARSITTRRNLWVKEITFPDGSTGYASDGTPVDCVRLANLGLVEGWTPEVIVSGINHGANLGEDITYSGTVAAALEGVILGIPGIAASQHSSEGGLSVLSEGSFDFGPGAAFVARLLNELTERPLAPATLLNVNFPGGEPVGVEVCGLGRRVYLDELSEISRDPARGREYRIYGDAAPDPEDEDTDTAAVAAGRVAITPLHFDLTHHDSLGELSERELEHLLSEPV